MTRRLTVLTFQQTRQATDFKRTTAAAIALGVDYKDDDPEYHFILQPQQPQDAGKLSPHFGKCACVTPL